MSTIGKGRGALLGRKTTVFVFLVYGIGKYSFVGDNEIVFNKFDKPFVEVILSDCSQCPVHP